MAQYFKTPFANAGTRSSIPDTQPADGAVNWSTGYSAVYQLDPATQPAALRVERDKHNELHYQITDTLKAYYETCIPPFITSSMNGGVPFPYTKDSLVKLGGVVYSSNVNSNTTTPPGASWTVVDMAVFNAKAPTASPAFTGVPTAPTASVAFPSNTLQLANYQFTADFIQWVGLFGDAPRLATDLNGVIGAGFLYFNSSTANRSGYSSNGFVFTEFLGSGNDAVQVEWGTTEVNFRVKGGGAWGTSWRRLWSSRNSHVITTGGQNFYSQWRLYSNGDIVITLQGTAGSSGANTFTLPITLPSTVNTTVMVTPRSNSYPAPGPYGATLSTTQVTVYGPAGGVNVYIMQSEVM